MSETDLERSMKGYEAGLSSLQQFKALAKLCPKEDTRTSRSKKFIEDQTFEERYPQLSLEPLGWRYSLTKLPEFAVFSVDDPIMTLFIQEEYDVRTKRKPYLSSVSGSIDALPDIMREYYAKGFMSKNFESYCQEKTRKNPHGGKWYSHSWTLEAEFKKLIPQWVQEKIEVAKKDFSTSINADQITKRNWFRMRALQQPISTATTNIFLIAEVENWNIKKTKGDFLVVGYKNDRLWLICSFEEAQLG